MHEVGWCFRICKDKLLFHSNAWSCGDFCDDSAFEFISTKQYCSIIVTLYIVIMLGVFVLQMQLFCMTNCTPEIPTSRLSINLWQHFLLNQYPCKIIFGLIYLIFGKVFSLTFNNLIRLFCSVHIHTGVSRLIH